MPDVDFLFMSKMLIIRNSGEKYKECELPEMFPVSAVDDESLSFSGLMILPSGKNGGFTF